MVEIAVNGFTQFPEAVVIRFWGPMPVTVLVGVPPTEVVISCAVVGEKIVGVVPKLNVGRPLTVTVLDEEPLLVF